MQHKKKLKIACLHINSVSADSLSTGVRLTRYMSLLLDVPFIHNKQTAIAYKDKYDILFVKFGILMFCDYREELFDLYKNAKRIIAIEEDYTMGPDYRLTKLNPSLEVWSNMPWRAQTIGGAYINWNRMTWKHNTKWERTVLQPAPIRGLGYYGAYRPDREKYFKKYLADAPYTVNVSTFPRNKLKFRDLDPKIHVFDNFKSRSQIGAFQAVLYIEDEFTHTHYNSPANRFYECLSNYVPIIFDWNCIGTFEKSGYDITPYAVKDQFSLHTLLSQSDLIAKNQRKKWYRNYQQELFEDIKRVIKKQIGEQYGLQSDYPHI